MQYQLNCSCFEWFIKVEEITLPICLEFPLNGFRFVPVPHFDRR